MVGQLEIAVRTNVGTPIPTPTVPTMIIFLVARKHIIEQAVKMFLDSLIEAVAPYTHALSHSLEEGEQCHARHPAARPQ